MADLPISQPSEIYHKNRYAYARKTLWGVFGLLTIVMIVAQIYVLAAGQNSSGGEAGTTLLAQTGIAYVQNSLRTFAANPAFPFLALAVAFLLGGLHTLTPGHNKVLTGAYLVSANGRIRHAVLIGVATAISHTFSVIIIGSLAITVRGQSIAAFYLKWLGVPSGLVVVGLGVLLLTRHLKGETGHTHKHADGTEHAHVHDHIIPSKLTLSGLVALGLIHGIVPTTDALAVLLVALTIEQTALGIGLIFTYSIGIAVVMSSIGILFVKSQMLLTSRFERLTRWMPTIAAVLVVLFGLSILIRALAVSF